MDSISGGRSGPQTGAEITLVSAVAVGSPTSIQITGVRGASKLEMLVFAVVSTTTNTINIDLAEHGLTHADITTPTEGGAWRETPLERCDGKMRAFEPIQINTISAGLTEGDHIADNLKVDLNRGLICRMIIGNDDYSQVNITDNITVFTDFSYAGAGGLEEILKTGTFEPYINVPAAADQENMFRFAFSSLVSLSEIIIQVEMPESGHPEKPLLNDVQVIGSRNGASEVIADNVIINSPSTTSIPIASSNTYDEITIKGISESGDGYVVIVKYIQFVIEDGAINASFDNTYINVVGLADVVANKATWLEIEGVDENSDPVQVFYPLIAPTYSENETPKAIPSGSMDDGYDPNNVVDVFLVYPPPMVGTSIALTLHDAPAGVVDASLLMLGAYLESDGFETVNKGQQTAFRDLAERVRAADGVTIVTDDGREISKSYVLEFADDRDSATYYQALSKSRLWVMDVYPQGGFYKRYSNIVIGRLDGEIEYLPYGNTIGLNLLDTKPKRKPVETQALIAGGQIIIPGAGVGYATWENATNITTGNGTLEKTAADGWDSSATFGVIPQGSDGHIEYRVGYIDLQCAVGLNTSSDLSDVSWTGIDYAVHTKDDGTLQFLRGGVIVAMPGSSYQIGDLFQIEVSGVGSDRSVIVRQNGQSIWVESSVPDDDYYFDCSFYSACRISNIQMEVFV